MKYTPLGAADLKVSSVSTNGRIVNDLSPDAMINSIHPSQALGASTAYTWMKMPVMAEMERVMNAATFPMLQRCTGPVRGFRQPSSRRRKRPDLVMVPAAASRRPSGRLPQRGRRGRPSIPASPASRYPAGPDRMVGKGAG